MVTDRIGAMEVNLPLAVEPQTQATRRKRGAGDVQAELRCSRRRKRRALEADPQ